LKRIDSSYAIVLTGTPLENKLEELVSVAAGKAANLVGERPFAVNCPNSDG
jgi:SNF2 family DNA or RNA helicase